MGSQRHGSHVVGGSPEEVVGGSPEEVVGGSPDPPHYGVALLRLSTNADPP